jgi:hypothetical protein
MSTRLREAREACEEARQERAMSPAGDTPDLFSEWTEPASPPEGWVDRVLAIIEATARTHETFTVEAVRPHVPPTVDYRSLGAVFSQAARLGYIAADGWVSGDGKMRHGRPIRRWVSLLRGER